MNKIIYFYIKGCPYCMYANRAIDELKEENEAYREIQIESICEEENPDIVDNYDYYYTPCMFIGDSKLYEANPSQGYDDIRSSIKQVFDQAIQS